METNKKILIIEDDQFLREFYQELLQDEGFTVDLAADGDIALSKVKEGDYDLIMLDIMLPKIDGLQILRELKVSPPKQKNGPIVVLTNLGQDAIIKQAFALGAEGYLIKSALDPVAVLTEVKSYLNKSENHI